MAENPPAATEGFGNKKRSPSAFAEGLLAGDEGFEPSQTESESGVLPLHKSPTNKSYYTTFSENVNT